MREFSVRAHLHRRDLGDGSAAEAARVLSVDVENPHLLELVDADGPSLLDDLLGKQPSDLARVINRGPDVPQRRASDRGTGCPITRLPIACAMRDRGCTPDPH
jgi:hypothetical protein